MSISVNKRRSEPIVLGAACTDSERLSELTVQGDKAELLPHVTEGELQPREMKWLGLDHTGSLGQYQEQNPSLQSLRPAPELLAGRQTLCCEALENRPRAEGGMVQRQLLPGKLLQVPGKPQLISSGFIFPSPLLLCLPISRCLLY